MPKDNLRKIQEGKHGFWLIRVFRRKAHGKKSSRVLCKCGCCNESLEIYHDEDSLEINGVVGSLENWREILLPLLQVEKDADLSAQLLRLALEAADALWALQKGKTPPRDPIAINQDIHNLRTKIGKRVIMP